MEEREWINELVLLCLHDAQMALRVIYYVISVHKYMYKLYLLASALINDV